MQVMPFGSRNITEYLGFLLVSNKERNLSGGASNTNDTSSQDSLTPANPGLFMYNKSKEEMQRKQKGSFDSHTFKPWNTNHRQQVKIIKEKHAYVAQNFTKEMQSFKDDQIIQFQFPDGNIVEVGTERFQCCELMFQPGLIGQEIPGLETFVLSVLKLCDKTMHKTLASKVTLAGGAAALPGLGSRLQVELDAAVSKDTHLAHLKFNVITARFTFIGMERWSIL